MKVGDYQATYSDFDDHPDLSTLDSELISSDLMIPPILYSLVAGTKLLLVVDVREKRNVNGDGDRPSSRHCCCSCCNLIPRF
jgi:hypothetical protein